MPNKARTHEDCRVEEVIVNKIKESMQNYFRNDLQKIIDFWKNLWIQLQTAKIALKISIFYVWRWHLFQNITFCGKTRTVLFWFLVWFGLVWFTSYKWRKKRAKAQKRLGGTHKPFPASDLPTYRDICQLNKW